MPVPYRTRAPTTICPRTGSRVFIDELLCESADAVEFSCRVCDGRHWWQPDSLCLVDLDQPRQIQQLGDVCGGPPDPAIPR